QVDATPVPLDPQIPEWGDSRYLDTTLTGRLRVADALTHLYVLLPVLDGAKHYWVDAAEVDKLLGAGGEWLAAHPERELITKRYLAHRVAYVRTAMERLAEADDTEIELPALEHAILGVARPATLVVTTPNVEYNVRFETLKPGRFRHTDHR